MNIGIIGAGGIARKLHLPQLADLSDEGVRVTHLAGRKQARLSLLATQFGVPNTTTDYRELLADDSIDGIVIALPHPMHVPIGLEAIAAGKHILMQKPLCGNMEEADAFVDAAERSNRCILALPHYGAEIYAVRNLVNKGAIGKLSGAHCRVSHGGPEVYYAEIRDYFNEGSDDSELWFFAEGEASVGALFDMGVYAIGALVAVMGSVVSVMGQTATVDKPTGLEDTATLILRFENGAIGCAETGWCDPARTFQLSVHGTRGKVSIPGATGGGITHYEPGSYTREDTPAIPHAVEPNREDAFDSHRLWLNCIRSGRQPELSNAWTARHITEIMLAGLESSKSGSSVAIHSRAHKA